VADSYDAAVYSSLGTARERLPLPTDPFDGTVNVPVMHQAVKAFLANQRQGNAATKIRKFVTGGNQKPWKQKGTGRARQGSIRAPNWVGGGTVFGPIPRSYAQYVPRQVRALARRSAFNARAAEGAVVLVDAFRFDAPSTRRLATLVEKLGLSAKKVLILTDGVKPALHLSGRNLPTVHVMPYSDVSTYHLLWSDVVVIEATAVGHTLEPLAERETAPTVSALRAARAAAAEKAGAAAPAAKPAKAKAEKKAVTTAEKKPAAKKAAKVAKKAAAKPAAKAAKKAAPSGKKADKPKAEKKAAAKKPKKKGK
jgi:large subunit ribosomal protein L4